MTPSKEHAYRHRARFAWGDPELEVIVSLEGAVPSCFSPDPNALFFLRTLPESDGSHEILRKCVERNPVLAYACAQHGVPEILRMYDIQPTGPSPTLQRPEGGPITH